MCVGSLGPSVIYHLQNGTGSQVAAYLAIQIAAFEHSLSFNSCTASTLGRSECILHFLSLSFLALRPNRPLTNCVEVA